MSATTTSLSLEQALRNLSPGRETVFETVHKLTEDGKKDVLLRVGSRILQPEPAKAPDKYPSPARAHVIYDIEGFVSYLKGYGTDNTVVFADPGHGVMKAVIDEKAGTGFEIISFVPQIHPIFKPWDEILSATKPVEIKDFVDFLGRNRRAIIEPNGRELAFALSQVRMSRRIEIHQGTRTNSVNGVLVETNIEGKTQNDFVELPETIKVNAPIYLQTSRQSVEVDISLGGNESVGVLVRLSAGDLLEKKAELFDTMLTQVRNGVGDKITVTTGAPSHVDWDVIE